jgi:hypothetical protein
MSEFWDKNPEAWKACHIDVQPVAKGMKDFVAWG